MRQRRPADPTDPGDAADLSIMGQIGTKTPCPRGRFRPFDWTFAQDCLKINSFLTVFASIPALR
ncbi:MAG: hypothetical protein F9K19_01485 [Rhizobiaceae bacterium]|nr:MAG: hypothetical protein F9K19_01485 [Rhizobiaceae bacterium]